MHERCTLPSPDAPARFDYRPRKGEHAVADRVGGDARDRCVDNGHCVRTMSR